MMECNNILHSFIFRHRKEIKKSIMNQLLNEVILCHNSRFDIIN